MIKTDEEISGLRIGEFLVSIEAMKGWQVRTILTMQRAGDIRMFGQIAIDKNYIDDFALRRYMDYRMLPATPIIPDSLNITSR